MSSLVLELHQGEWMILNGASIRFRTRSRIELADKARFLFGRQIMAPHQANSPARRIYLALQSAYIGGDLPADVALEAALGFVLEFKSGTTPGTCHGALDQAMMAASRGEFHKALKLTRTVIDRENENIAFEQSVHAAT